MSWGSKDERTRGARFAVVALTAGFLAALAWLFPLRPPDSVRSASAAASPNAPHPLIGKYCLSCHDDSEQAAGLSLEGRDLAHVGEDAEVWEKVARKLGAGVMPPAGNPRPAPEETAQFLRTVTQRLDEAPVPAAPVLISRLNRTAYANAIRDLLGLRVDVASLLPPDAASKGFDNVAAVLSTSPALIQGYLDAALKISRLAVGDVSTEPERVVYRAPPALSQETPFEGLPLGTRGGLRVTHYFPLDAEYEISVQAGPGSSGFLRRAPGPMPLVDLAIDGEAVPLGTDGPTRDSPKVMGPVRIKVAAGNRTLTAALFDATDAAGVNDLYQVYPRKGAIFDIVVNGPFAATGPGDTESRRRIFICSPQAPAGEAHCARDIVAHLAGRAFRRPMPADGEDVTRIMAFYEDGRARDGFEAGIQQALAYILMDPRFLYRIEHEPAQLEAGRTFRLDDVDLASRLSFFLWSSLPDEPLMQAASSGRLHEPAELARQVRRMLADERAGSLVDDFAAQWLQLRQLAAVQPEGRAFDDNLRQAFAQELKLAFTRVLREDRSILELLDADYTFVNERLARHYGIDGVSGDRFREVALPPDSPRRGLLGKGAILTVTSVANRTSPVIRGAWVLENVLGVPPSPPPPGVENNLDATAAAPTTLRQRLAQHRVNKACASCHNMMDPIGLALENYDYIGQWRTLDGSLPIDASGVMVDGTRLGGAADLRQALVARSDQFVETFVEKLMTFALGRHVTYRDMPAIRRIARDAATKQDRLSAIVLGIVTSEPFLMRTKSGPASDVPGTITAIPPSPSGAG